MSDMWNKAKEMAAEAVETTKDAAAAAADVAADVAGKTWDATRDAAAVREAEAEEKQTSRHKAIDAALSQIEKQFG